MIGVTTLRDALQALRDAPICATIANHMLQGTSGTQLVPEKKLRKPDVPITPFSGSLPARLNYIDVYLNKGEATQFLER